MRHATVVSADKHIRRRALGPRQDRDPMSRRGHTIQPRTPIKLPAVEVDSTPAGSATRPSRVLPSRIRAALLHLGLSVAVAALAALLVFGLWYPVPFREISGGRELFFIVIAVDVVLGPVITFAVFDRRKPWRELRRDLILVVMFQLAGLAYGLHTVYVVRPVVMALEGDRLRVIRDLDLAAADLTKAPPEFQRLPLWGVWTIAARQPRPDEKLKSIEMGLAGIDIGMRPEFWLASSATGAAMALAAQPLDKLRKLYPNRAAELSAAIVDARRPAGALKFIPILARRTDWVALVDAGTGDIVGYAPFDGF